jgi:hypothetical protein
MTSYPAMFSATTTAIVFEATVLLKGNAKRNSFHAPIKVKMQPAAKPGAESGNTIFRRTCNLLQPSTRAACSRSIGISRKKTVKIQTRNGNLLSANLLR